MSRSSLTAVVERARQLSRALMTGACLLVDGGRRSLFREMWEFETRLPALLKRPLPDALGTLGDAPSSPRSAEVGERDIRRVADLVALLDRRSPLGLCLRRSLTRYHFLRRAGLPVELRFGARPKGGQGARSLAGHAWVTLDGRPYFEADPSWRSFVVMLAWPDRDAASASGRPH